METYDYSKIKVANYSDIANDIHPDVSAFIKLKGRDRLMAPMKIKRFISKVIHMYFNECAEKMVEDANGLNLYRLGNLRMVSTKITYFPKKVIYYFDEEGNRRSRREPIRDMFDGKPWYMIFWDRPMKYKRFKFVPSKKIKVKLSEARANNVPVLDYSEFL